MMAKTFYAEWKCLIVLICYLFGRVVQGDSNSLQSNATTNCTAAHPTTAPSSYDCRAYQVTGGYCSQILGGKLVYGSQWDVWYNEKKLQRFEEGRKIMLAYGLRPRQTCLDMFTDVYCHWYFPHCDVTESFVQKQPLCRESCELLMKMCDKELEMALRFNEQQAGGGFPYYWEIMNCTTMNSSNGGKTPECYFQNKINTETDKLQSKECYHGNGIGYRGDVNMTRSGYICQSWSSQCPHRHIRTPENSPELADATNWCRNAGGQAPDGPWCYTTDPNVRWVYCDIPKCPDPAPSRSPTNVKATAHNATAIIVQWSRVPQEFIHGTLKGHRILYKRSGMPVEQSILIQPSVTKAVISSLVFSTNYSIQVLAVNEYGDGPRSQLVHVMTAPESIADVEIELTIGDELFHPDLTNRSSLRFMRLFIKIETVLMALYAESNNFKIYEIAIHRFRTGSVKADIRITAEFGGNHTKSDITNEVKGKLLESAMTGKIGALTLKSLSVKDAPPAPTNLQSKDISQNHVLLAWSELEHKDYYDVTNFTVQFRRSSSSAYLDGAIVQPGTNEGYVRDLEPGTDYVFRVLANNDHGSGESEELGATTLRHKASKLSTPVLVVSILLPVLFVVLATVLIVYLRIRNKRLKEDIEKREIAMEKLAAYLEGNSQNLYDSTGDIFSLLNIHANRQWWEIPRNCLEIGDLLGSGAFGEVKKGVLYSGKSSKGTECAVKMIKPQATEKEIRDLCNELNLLATVGEHQNIVGLIGACSVEGPLWVVVRFAAHGSLLDFLAKYRQPGYENTCDQAPKEVLSEKEKLKIAFDIAKGMAHLSKKKCVHRDLAARNVLLDSDNTAMVSDFGLSRDVYESGAYENTSGGMLPVRWMAPESLEEYTYTTQSDVWSFGVVLWEIETAGRMPYAGMSGTEIVERIRRGYRLFKPECCSQVMHNIMTDCWEHDPKERPSFQQLVQRLEKLLFSASGYLELLSMETKDSPQKNDYDPVELKRAISDEGEIGAELEAPTPREQSPNKESNDNTESVQRQKDTSKENENNPIGRGDRARSEGSERGTEDQVLLPSK